MADSDRDIVITPNKGQSAEPNIVFTGSDNVPITLKVLDDGTLTFLGSTGEIFSISGFSSDSKIFTVNDASGVPVIEVLQTGEVRFAPYSGTPAYAPNYQVGVVEESNNIIDLVFSAGAGYMTRSVTGPVTISGYEYIPGVTKTLRLASSSSANQTLTVPDNWIFVGVKPASISANRVGILTVTSFGTTDLECVAAYTEES